MYQNTYPKTIISISIYSIDKPEAGYGRGGGLQIYIYTYMVAPPKIHPKSF